MQGFWEGFSHSLPKTAELPGQRRSKVTNSQGETPKLQGSQFSAGCFDISQAQLKTGIPQPETSQPSLHCLFPPFLCLQERFLKLIYKAVHFIMVFSYKQAIMLCSTPPLP